MEHLLLADGEECLAPAADRGQLVLGDALGHALLEREGREQVLEHDQVLQLGGLAQRVDERLPVLESARLAAADGEHARQGALGSGLGGLGHGTLLLSQSGRGRPLRLKAGSRKGRTHSGAAARRMPEGVPQRRGDAPAPRRASPPSARLVTSVVTSLLATVPAGRLLGHRRAQGRSAGRLHVLGGQRPDRQLGRLLLGLRVVGISAPDRDGDGPAALPDVELGGGPRCS